MEDAVQNKPRQSIQAVAYRFLGRRALFSKELIAKLKQKGYEEDEIMPLIAQFTERGWLNDQELAKRYVEQQVQKGVGAQWIRLKLKEKAGKVACPIEDSEEALLQFVKKKYLNDLQTNPAKVIRALLRRGFSYALIQQALKEALLTLN